jgi:hypothetical protein
MDKARFTEAEEERRQAPTELCEWINRGLKPRGSVSALAKLLGIAPSKVSKMRYGLRAPQARELRIIEAYFGEPAPIDVGEAMTASLVPMRVRVIGNLIGGSRVVLLDGRLDEIVVPEPVPLATMAIEIRGEALGGLFDRWLLIYDDIRVPPSTDLRGSLCVIGLKDETVVKKLQNIAMLDGKPILWAAPVKQLVQKIAK